MPYLDQQPENAWQKRLFDKLKNMEGRHQTIIVMDSRAEQGNLGA